MDTRKLLLLSMICVGCGGVGDDSFRTGEDPQALGRAAGSAWQIALPGGVSVVTPVDSVLIGPCIYTLGTALEGPPFPPRTLVWLHRGGGRAGACTGGGYVVLGASYSTPSVSLAALDTWPSVQPFGMCGQDGSTTNFGTSTLSAGRGGAAEVRRDPAIANATTTARTMPALRHNNLWRAPLVASG